MYESLTFQTLCTPIWLKIVKNFCNANVSYKFSTKNITIIMSIYTTIKFVSTVKLNICSTKDFVKLTMLWTIWLKCFRYNSVVLRHFYGEIVTRKHISVHLRVDLVKWRQKENGNMSSSATVFILLNSRK